MSNIILMRIAGVSGKALPKEIEANAIMQDENFREYIAKNGYHFTCKLADKVTSEHLVNTDGTNHNWTSEQVKNALGMAELPNNHTWGDAGYAANWIYSDQHPMPYKTDMDVIEATKRYLNDPDGYEGQFFMRWLSDIIGRGMNVDWATFV